MADDTNTAEREAFEAWARKNGLIEESHGIRSEWSSLSVAESAFQAGRASLAASVGSEPVAVAEVSCTHVHGWGTRWIVDADRKLNIPPLGTKLYARPPAPKQGQKDSSRLRKALIRAQQAINSMKVEAETAAQGDKRMMLEACETISNEGLQADMAIRDVLANHPSPPEGMAGWISVDKRLPESGTPVLLDIGKKFPIRAMWAAKHTVEASPECADDWAEYDEATDTYYCPEGWYEWNQNEETHWAVNETPRAWMPLPAFKAKDA